MAPRFMPVPAGFIVTDTFGYQQWRQGTHWGVDYGLPGGSGGQPIYAAQGGTVVNVGYADGFGQWIVLDHSTADGSGTTVYGHVIPQVRGGQRVEAGQRIGYINPVKGPGNGNVPPHLHFEVHRTVWSPNGRDRLDPTPWLTGALWPGSTPPPTVTPPTLDDGDAAIWDAVLTQMIGARR